MSRFVTPSDFDNGELSIPQTQYSVDELQEVIDELEPKNLRELLGVGLYDAFVLDWDTAPTEQFSEDRFKVIYDAFAIDSDCGILFSEGIKKLVMYFVYYAYTADTVTSKRLNGFVQEKNDNSEAATAIQAATFKKYNMGVKTYNSIQRYIHENPEGYDYEDFNGQSKECMTWI